MLYVSTNQQEDLHHKWRQSRICPVIHDGERSSEMETDIPLQYHQRWRRNHIPYIQTVHIDPQPLLQTSKLNKRHSTPIENTQTRKENSWGSNHGIPTPGHWSRVFLRHQNWQPPLDQEAPRHPEPFLTKKILLSEKVPDTVEEWAQKAIDIDSNYWSALEILGKYASKMTPPRTMTPPRATFNYRKKEERDPNAMDVDAMSIEEWDSLMKKGGMFQMQETRTSSPRLRREETNWQEANYPNQHDQQQQTAQTMWHKEASCSLYGIDERREGRTTRHVQRREEGWRGTWWKGFLKRRPAPASVSPTLLSISSLLYTWKEHNAMYLPIKISSNTGKQIDIVEALLDSRASRKFIDQDYARNIHAKRKNLERPIQVYNVDGTPNKKGTITQYVELEFEIHEWKRKHQLLVTGLGNQQIILGFTWLKEMNPIINWKKGTLEWRKWKHSTLKKQLDDSKTIKYYAFARNVQEKTIQEEERPDYFKTL